MVPSEHARIAGHGCTQIEGSASGRRRRSVERGTRLVSSPCRPELVTLS
jgi:hypothetical protein